MRRLAVLLLLCAGCRHAPKGPERPEKVTVRHVSDRLEGTSLFRAELVSVWAVDNGLKDPVTVSRWHLESTLERRPLPPPAVEPELTVPPGASSEVSLRQPVDLETLFEGRIPFYGNHVASIAPEVAGQPTTSVEQTLRLPGPPALGVTALHVTKTPMSFEVDLTLSLINPNGFAVEVERFDGEVLFAGDRFAKFAVGALTLAPGKRHPVPLTLGSSIARLNGLSRAALSSTEAVSTDVKARAVIEGREIPLATGSMVWPR